MVLKKKGAGAVSMTPYGPFGKSVFGGAGLCLGAPLPNTSSRRRKYDSKE